MRTKLYLIGLAFLTFATLANGQTGKQTKKQQITATASLVYTDANSNGICDNYEKHTPGNVSFGNRNGAGGGGQRAIQSQRGQGMCQGKGSGMGRGQARSANFVDANKNGVCDYSEMPAKK
jgi:hypothetical protein